MLRYSSPHAGSQRPKQEKAKSDAVFQQLSGKRSRDPLRMATAGPARVGTALGTGSQRLISLPQSIVAIKQKLSFIGLESFLKGF